MLKKFLDTYHQAHTWAHHHSAIIVLGLSLIATTAAWQFGSLFLGTQTHAQYSTLNCSTASNINVPIAECEALLDFYDNLDGPNRVINAGPGAEFWNTNTNICDRFGVDCTNIGGQERVSYIRFLNNNLSGTLPASLSNLEYMKFFRIVDNGGVSGILPPEWSSRSGLISFELQGTKIGGSLPSEWETWTNLQHFKISQARLNGELPETRSSRSGIIHFQVNNTKISGSLPFSWSLWPNIKRFIVYGNHLTGSLPTSWSDRGDSILLFDVKGNQIQGVLPNDWEVWDVRSFQVEGNNIVGSIPSEWIQNWPNNRNGSIGGVTPYISLHNNCLNTLGYNITEQNWINSHTHLIFEPQCADIAIDKQTDYVESGLGTQVVYTITYINNGPNPAQDVVIYDTPGAGLNLEQISGGYTIGSPIIMYGIPGDYCYESLSIDTTGPYVDALNQAVSPYNVDFQEFLFDYLNAPYINDGNRGPWLVDLVNDNNSISLSQIMNMVGLSIENIDPNCGVQTHPINIGTVPLGGSETIIITGSITEQEGDIYNNTISNQAYITSNFNPDRNQIDNQDSVHIAVIEPYTDLSILKTILTPGPYYSGMEIVYMLSYANNGPISSSSTNIYDVMTNGIITQSAYEYMTGTVNKGFFIEGDICFEQFMGEMTSGPYADIVQQEFGGDIESELINQGIYGGGPTRGVAVYTYLEQIMTGYFASWINSIFEQSYGGTPMNFIYPDCGVGGDTIYIFDIGELQPGQTGSMILTGLITNLGPTISNAAYIASDDFYDPIEGNNAYLTSHEPQNYCGDGIIASYMSGSAPGEIYDVSLLHIHENSNGAPAIQVGSGDSVTKYIAQLSGSETILSYQRTIQEIANTITGYNVYITGSNTSQEVQLYISGAALPFQGPGSDYVPTYRLSVTATTTSGQQIRSAATLLLGTFLIYITPADIQFSGSTVTYADYQWVLSEYGTGTQTGPINSGLTLGLEAEQMFIDIYSNDIIDNTFPAPLFPTIQHTYQTIEPVFTTTIAWKFHLQDGEIPIENLVSSQDFLLTATEGSQGTQIQEECDGGENCNDQCILENSNEVDLAIDYLYTTVTEDILTPLWFVRGDVITYTVQYTNNSAITVNNITININIGTGSQRIDASMPYTTGIYQTPSPWGFIEVPYISGGISYNFTIDSLAPGETGLIIYTVEATGEGMEVNYGSGAFIGSSPLWHTAVISNPMQEPVELYFDNYDNVGYRLFFERLNLTINKSTDIDSIQAGDSLSYTISYYNEGPEDAEHVIIHELPGTGLTITDSSLPYITGSYGAMYGMTGDRCYDDFIQSTSGPYADVFNTWAQDNGYIDYFDAITQGGAYTGGENRGYWFNALIVSQGLYQMGSEGLPRRFSDPLGWYVGQYHDDYIPLIWSIEDYYVNQHIAVAAPTCGTGGQTSYIFDIGTVPAGSGGTIIITGIINDNIEEGQTMIENTSIIETREFDYLYDNQSTVYTPLTTTTTPRLPYTCTISASPTSGTRPLMTTFSLSLSAAGMGSLPVYTSYIDYGNGQTGISLTHTYTNVGTYIATGYIIFENQAPITCSTDIVVTQTECTNCGGGETFIPSSTPTIHNAPSVTPLQGRACIYNDEDYLARGPFTDTIGHWGFPYIDIMRISCLHRGRGTNKGLWVYEPNANITRAEVLKTVVKLLGVAFDDFNITNERMLYTGTIPFADINNTNWFAHYAQYAYSKGLTEGLWTTDTTGNKYIKPDQVITRYEAIKVIMTAYQAINKQNISLSGTTVLGDVIDPSNPYYRYIREAEVLGFISGVPQSNGGYNFEGQRHITRAEFAKITSIPFAEQLFDVEDIVLNSTIYQTIIEGINKSTNTQAVLAATFAKLNSVDAGNFVREFKVEKTIFIKSLQAILQEQLDL